MKIITRSTLILLTLTLITINCAEAMKMCTTTKSDVTKDSKPQNALNLPHGIWSEIASFLNMNEIICLAQTKHNFNDFVRCGLTKLSLNQYTPLENIKTTLFDQSTGKCRYPSLTNLNLSSCENLTDAILTTIAQKYHQITYLKLSWCNTLSTPNISLERLMILELDNCPNLTDAAIRIIFQDCPCLVGFYLSNSNQNIFPIASNSLATLALGNCPNLNSTTVSTIIQECPNLTIFYLYECDNLTNLKISSNNLKTLVLYGCINLSNVCIS